MATSISMPGAFLPDHSSNRRRTVFRPPQSPSLDSLISPASSAILSNLCSRKRPRIEPIEVSPRTTPRTIQPKPRSTSSYHRDAASPPPLTNVNYRLAGGLDSPAASFLQRDEQLQEIEAEQDYRVNRYTSSQSSRQPSNYAPQTPSLTNNPKHSKEIGLSSISGWHLRRTAWALTGGLAGKVISFCWNSAFYGFSAGGGPGYKLDIGTPDIMARTSLYEVEEKDNVFSDQYEREKVPGCFSETDLIQDYMSRPNAHDRSSNCVTPTQKRWDATCSTDSWVFVDADRSRESSPVRKKSRASLASTTSRPCVSEASSILPRSMTDQTADTAIATGASYASPRARPSDGHVHSRTNSHTKTQPRTHKRGSSTHNTSPYKPRLAHPTSENQPRSLDRARPSMANTPQRRQPFSITTAIPSPISPEITAAYQRQKRKEAKRQDQSLKRLNAQLRDMIREGREALGSRFEVVTEEPDPTHDDCTDDMDTDMTDQAMDDYDTSSSSSDGNEPYRKGWRA